MTQRLRQIKHARRLTALQWAIALAIGASACNPALAMRGHARVISAPGAPLQALVGLQGLTPDEAASLRVSVADRAAWQRAGLQPPVPLSSLVVRVEDGMDPTRKNLRVQSAQAPAGGAVDLVLDVRSNTGRRQVQVSVLVPLRGAGVDVAPPAVGVSSRTGGRAGSIHVKSGDTLFAIAQRNATPNASVYQMLAALWRANPEAFIQNNMNLVRAGHTLAIPDAAAARAVDPAEARHIFSEHAAAFARYRARIGAAAGADPIQIKGQDAASGTVPPADGADGAVASAPQDRVRLSAGQDQDGAEAQADQRASNARAMADAQDRMNQLQSNIDELNKALAGQGASASQAATPPGVQGLEDAAGAVGASASPEAVGAVGTAGASGALGTSDAAGVIGAASGTAVTAGPVSPPTPDRAAANAAADLNKDKISTTAMPTWLADNLLVIVTAVLALIALVIAWMLRGAGARRGDGDEESYDYDEAALDEAALNRKLDAINLDLDEPPADAPNRARRGPRV